jgi:hypothetical protein
VGDAILFLKERGEHFKEAPIFCPLVLLVQMAWKIHPNNI